jgi:hypothetical protein
MLRNLWISKEGESNFEPADFINLVLLILNHSVYDENFSVCPLYITTITTVYVEKIISHLNSDDWCWSKIDLIDFCKELVKNKLWIMLTEKLEADINNPTFLVFF